MPDVMTFAHRRLSYLQRTVWLYLAVFGLSFVPVVSAQTGSWQLQAFHRNGQTFLTWNETSNFFTEDLPHATYLTILGNNAQRRHRLYRHSQPITTANIAQAERIAEIGIGTGYNRHIYGFEQLRQGAPSNMIRRFVLQEGFGGVRPNGTGELPLNKGLYVFSARPGESGNYYYAITPVVNNVEDRSTLSAGNATPSVAEQHNPNWLAIVQNNPAVDRYRWEEGPIGDQYVLTRWEADPLSSVNSWPSNYMVVIYPNAPTPYKVDMSLHAWGSNILTYIDQVNYPNGILLTSTDSPQDWWTGWGGNRAPNNVTCDNGSCAGPGKFYTMKRMVSFIAWMKTRWPIDDNRVMCSGWSMGGSGAKMFCLRYPDVFNYINSWVGIGNPRGSATFLNEYEDAFGPVNQGMLSENGINIWDDLDMAKWLRANPRREIPFITYSNGVNDDGIGWQHAVDFYKALRDTKRPYSFTWGQDGHGQRADDMSLTGSSTNAGTGRLDFQKNKALPAFTNFSLDQNPEIDPSGGVNLYQRWDPNTIIDLQTHFEIELWMISQAPSAQASTSVTLRKIQNFRTVANQQFNWRFLQGTTVLQQGSAAADADGLVTVAGLTLSNSAKRKLVVDLSGTTPPPSPPTNVRIIR